MHMLFTRQTFRLLTVTILCTLFAGNYLAAQQPIRMTIVDPINDLVTLENLGASIEDVSTLWLCRGPGQYAPLTAYANINPGFTLAAGESVTIDVTTASSGNVSVLDGPPGQLGLFANQNFGSSSPDDVLDYIQYGGVDSDSRGEEATTAGRWDDGNNFVAENRIPFVFTGGIDDFGSTFYTASSGVRITQINTINNSFTLQNLGSVQEDISGFFFCQGPMRYFPLAGFGALDFVLDPGEELVIDAMSQTTLELNDQAALFSTNTDGSVSGGSFFSTTTDPSLFLDFVQWGTGAASSGNRVAQAVTAGRWDDETSFVLGEAPFNFQGGVNEVGVGFWTNDTEVRITMVNPFLDIATVTNLDTIAQDVSTFFFCTAAGVYPSFSDPSVIQIVEGDLMLDPGESVTLEVLSAGGIVDAGSGGGSIFLFSNAFSNGNAGFNNDNPEVQRDFVQWEPNAFRVMNALNAGRWDDAALFAPSPAPHRFIGGADDVGSTFWLGAEQPIRFSLVNTAANSITLSNLGMDDVDISPFFLCLGPGQYAALTDYDGIMTGTMLVAGESITIDLSTGPDAVNLLNAPNGQLVLFSSNTDGVNTGPAFFSSSNDPEFLLDFVQYGAADQTRAQQAVDAGRWDATTSFVATNRSPFIFSGGADDFGVSNWSASSGVRLTQVNPNNNTIILQNLGSIDEDISGFFLCLGPGQYAALTDYDGIMIGNDAGRWCRNFYRYHYGP